MMYAQTACGLAADWFCAFSQWAGIVRDRVTTAEKRMDIFITPFLFDPTLGE